MMQANRNIKDFFKPFVRFQRNVAHDVEHLEAIPVPDTPAPAITRSEGTTIDAGTSSSQKNNKDIPILASASRESPLYATTLDVERTAAQTSSFSSSLSSLVSTPLSSASPDHVPPTRTMRQLSPLSMRSSKSPTPQPPPVRSPVLSPPPSRRSKRLIVANVSFASTSTHSGAPVSSQSSSRRIIRDGRLAVTNSDSDSMDSMDSMDSIHSMDENDEELDEIEELIKQKRLGTAAVAPRIPTPATSTQQGNPYQTSAQKRTSREAKSPQGSKYKFSLAKLVEQSKTEGAWSEKRKKYDEQDLMDEADEKRQKTQHDRGQRLGLNQVVDDVRGINADAQEKTELVRALKRMDALQEEVHYHFFRRTEIVPSPVEFPVHSVAGTKAWKALMNDKTSRDQAFKSGFIADMIRTLPLPEDVLQWTLRALLYEDDADLSLGYVCAIRAHFKNSRASLDTLHDGFLEISGRDRLTSPLEAWSPTSTDMTTQLKDSAPLGAVKRCSTLVRDVAMYLPISERSCWLHLLMLVLIDRNVQEDAAVKTAVQQSVAALMDVVSADKVDVTIREVGVKIIASVSNPILMHRLLSSLPSTNGAIHTLKRRLALSHFMKSTDYLSDRLDRSSITGSVTTMLKRSGEFRIKEDTDYAAMGARIGILDVAVGSGFADFNFMAKAMGNRADTTVIGDGTGRRQPASPEEVEFNQSIDALVSELRLIMSSIRDSGAAHMLRMECKSMLEKLAYRLEYAARTRPKPKKSAFGGGDQSVMTGDSRLQK